MPSYISFYFICFIFWPSLEDLRILVPQPGLEPQPCQWKHRDLSTGLPGNFLWVSFFNVQGVNFQTWFFYLCIFYPISLCLMQASEGISWKRMQTCVTCSRIRMLLSLKEGRSERLQTPTPAWASADSSCWSSCEKRRACSPEWGPSKPSSQDSAGEGAERGTRKLEWGLVCVPTGVGMGLTSNLPVVGGAAWVPL